jgi:hypothetical protein
MILSSLRGCKTWRGFGFVLDLFAVNGQGPSCTPQAEAAFVRARRRITESWSATAQDCGRELLRGLEHGGLRERLNRLT